MKCIAAGAHLLIPWIFELMEPSDNRADYCQDCSFFYQCEHQVLIFTVQWTALGLFADIDIYQLMATFTLVTDSSVVPEGHFCSVHE